MPRQKVFVGLCRMRIKFNGIVEKRKSGCGVCGRRRSSSQFQTTKSYTLPSGVRMTFRAGQAVELSDGDAAFLLQYKYRSHDGEVKQVFEVV